MLKIWCKLEKIMRMYELRAKDVFYRSPKMLLPTLIKVLPS